MQGKKVMIAAADTFRAAAIEQLQVWAERVGALFHARAAGSDPASVAFEAMDRALAEQVLRELPDLSSAGEGLRFSGDTGSAYLLPLPQRKAIRIVGEGPAMEAAAELCDFCAKKIRELDKKAAERNSSQIVL